MIKIELRLFADLVKFLPKDPLHYEIEDGISIRQLVSNLGIQEEKAKIVFVNGKKKDLDEILKQDDRIGIFPPVGGG